MIAARLEPAAPAFNAVCNVCGNAFRRVNSLTQVACSLRCAIRVPVIERKAQAQADRERKAKLNPRHEAALTQDVMNRYVRLRDAHLGCVSCDKPASWPGQWHASHLRSRGAASGIRFHLWNIHKACSICNHFDSGNVAEYEIRLRARIGDEKVDWLKCQNHRVTYPVEYLKRLRAVFAKKARRLEKRRAAQ